MLNVSGFWFAFVTVSTMRAYLLLELTIQSQQTFKAQMVLIQLTIGNMISEFGREIFGSYS